MNFEFNYFCALRFEFCALSMRQSELFSKTLKEAPKDEKSISAKLLIRAGFIDKVSSGRYFYIKPFTSKINEVEQKNYMLKYVMKYVLKNANTGKEKTPNESLDRALLLEAKVLPVSFSRFLFPKSLYFNLFDEGSGSAIYDEYSLKELSDLKNSNSVQYIYRNKICKHEDLNLSLSSSKKLFDNNDDYLQLRRDLYTYYQEYFLMSKKEISSYFMEKDNTLEKMINVDGAIVSLDRFLVSICVDGRYFSFRQKKWVLKSMYQKTESWSIKGFKDHSKPLPVCKDYKVSTWVSVL